MSRVIDLTKKLSDEDREYLLARGREQQVFLNDAEHSDDPAAQEIAFYVPGTSVDKAEGVPPTPPPTEEDVAETYTGPNWTKDALKAEIERRNAEYDEEFQMSTEGSKADLVARLVEDDLTTE